LGEGSGVGRWEVCRVGEGKFVHPLREERERRRDPFSELVDLVRRVSESVVVSNVVEELLGVESSSEEEGEVSVRGLDDVGDFVHGVATVEGVLIDETVFETLG
jgi:hypothetical protein